MKSYLIYLSLILITLVLTINVVFASFEKGDEPEGLETDYNPGESLKGWINISLDSESTGSLITAFDSSMSILDFLEYAEADYDCLPADCESGYVDSARSTSKTFSLDFGERETIGFKINGENIEITSASFKITSNAGEASYPQLSVDILDNGEIEWQAYSASGNFGIEEDTCFDPNGNMEQAEITQTHYCEKIQIRSAADVEIGANVSAIPGKGGNVDFEMTIYNDELEDYCIATASGSGKISCVVNDFNIPYEQDFFVCINTKSSFDNNKYSISYEQNEPCGFSDYYDELYEFDFEIFAKPGKFSALGSFILDNTELLKAESIIDDLAEYMDYYIYDRYERDCTNDCIIPIKFISGLSGSHSLTISDASLSYISGVSKTTYYLYDLEETEAEINMDFQRFYLNGSNLTVPESSGIKTLDLELDGNSIVSKEILVSQGPKIDLLIPLTVSAAIPVKFIVFTSGGNITGYKWDFGDGTAVQETTINNTYHTYNKTGEYNLKVSAINSLGEGSKTFSVKALAPKEAINITLIEKRQNLNNTMKNLREISGWYKSVLEKKAGLDELDIALRNLEKKYETATSSSEYTDIMTQLTELEIPYSLKISESLSGDFLPDIENINAGYLEKLSGEDVTNPEDYLGSIASWFIENLEVSIETKVYSLYYDGNTVPILNFIKLKIKPKADFSRDVYLIVEKSYENIDFNPNQDYMEKTAGDATGITLPSLTENKEETIEFVIAGEINILSLPIYLSPQFSLLPSISGEPGVCNFNDKCEKSQGETWKNCRNDCKPWERVMVYLILLLSIAFVVYIVLQEWYKRKYENHLFPNRNDLFNLINFISNALNQGFNKDDIIKRLGKHGWKREQIIYSFRKVKGLRTGMWEIPIFKFFEQRRIKEEIAKRQQNFIKKIR